MRIAYYSNSKALPLGADKAAPCGHLMRMKCNQSPEGRICHKPCSRLLPCGHPCTEKCLVDCTKVQCKVLTDSPVNPACGHPAFKIPCHLNTPELRSGSDELVQLCKHPCGQQMDCSHHCTGNCGACMQGRLHVPCNQLCSRILVCGHRCTAKCNMFCSPCFMRCVIRCSHEKCYGKTRNNHPCYRPCNRPCDKPCMWKCKHFQCGRRCGEECDRPPCYEPCQEVLGCGHPCVGYCGEPCPPICAICNVDDPTIQSNASARYVLLEDCKHVIEGSLLDSLVASATENNTFRLMRCPLPECSEPVANTERCKTTYFRFRKQVIKINEIVNEDEIVRVRKMHTSHARLLASEPSISATMNSLLTLCSEPFRVLPQSQLKGYELGRPMVACLLHPLAVLCKHLKLNFTLWLELVETEEVQRLKQRLEYLARVLLTRLDQIGDQAVQQIELIVAQTLRLATNKTSPLSWYDISPYTWQADRALSADQLTPLPLPLPPVHVTKFTSTLRTRDSAKQWFLCDNQHLYVSENGEPCVTCKDETEENQLRVEGKQQRMNHRIQNYRDRHYGLNLGPIRVPEFRRERFQGGWKRGRNPQWIRSRSPIRGRGRCPQPGRGRSPPWVLSRISPWQ